ncbi:MAG: TIGR03067 domain-containing protein [Gemmataceae bacterium]|nr:TIGR03067 domain-containing protein [Gemmataceae bacterium]
MKKIFAILFMACVLAAADTAKVDEKLNGSYVGGGGETNGKPFNKEDLKDFKLVIKGGQYTLNSGTGESVQGIQSVDITKSPKTIDATDASGRNKGKTILGIYEIKGDEFKVSFSMPGKPRPTKFTTEKDESGQWVHIWKRVK